MAAALAAAVVAAAEYSEWEEADGSFPDHGGCTMITQRNRTFADDLKAMQDRTAETQWALSWIQRPNHSTRPFPIARRAVKGNSAATGCAGIDDCIQKTATAAGVPFADLTTDAEFLRRVRLDLTGRIPTRQEVVAFLSDTSADKRATLVESLLEKPEWADRWAHFFGDLFRNTTVTAQINRYPYGRDSFHLYLLESMQENKPYDQMAREMIAAEGTGDGRAYPETYSSYQQFTDTYDDLEANPVKASPVGYIIGARTTGGPIQDTYDKLAFITARDFLGISLMDCILCHDGVGRLDGLSLWGAGALRLEGWRLAAFFSDIPRLRQWRPPKANLPVNPSTGRTVKANYYYIHDLQLGAQESSKGGDTAGIYLGQTEGGNRSDRLHAEQVVQPSYPFEGVASANAGTRLRERLGVRLTADPQFSRAAVNYVWREFFARGIVEPADQFDLERLDRGAPPTAGWDIQPSHPQLLEWLAEAFRDNGFDLKWLMRTIVLSDTYQLSSRYDGVFSPSDERYFVRHQVKRLTAEQVHDAISLAGGQFNSYDISSSLQGLRFAMQFPDVKSTPPGGTRQARMARALLQAFTPGDREETARSRSSSPLQALNLMNNRFVLNQVVRNAKSGTLFDSLQLGDDRSIVTHLYLSVLSRYPTEGEVSFAVEYLEGGPKNRKNRASDLMWALFNKADFQFNY